MENTFQVFEWRIENISGWNIWVHGEAIKSPQSSGLDLVRHLELQSWWNGGTNDFRVIFHPGKVVPSSGGNLSLLCSDGSVICTKRTHTEGWDNTIRCGFSILDVLARTKSKGNQLILRVCFWSNTSHVDTVSTTLEFSEMHITLDPLSVKNMESGDSENISIIHYNRKNYLDELLLKADHKDESIQFILELLTKSGKGVFVESLWSLQSSDGKTKRNGEEKTYAFTTCELWTVSSLSLSELTDEDIRMQLDLKIFSGEISEKRIETPQKEISMDLNQPVCFFHRKSFKSNDSANKTKDSSAVLKYDFMHLLQNQDLSDVTLKCGDVTFPAHKNIMSARSPVFKTMLSCDMKEAASGQVVIGDLDPSTLSLFLTFLYTGEVGDLQCDSALNLYYAAEKYQVPSLKSECAEFLCSNVSFSNVCDILSFADKHGDDVLVKVSHNFILDNYNQVLRSKEWEGFMEQDPSLAVKTLCGLGQQNYVEKSSKPFLL